MIKWLIMVTLIIALTISPVSAFDWNALGYASTVCLYMGVDGMMDAYHDAYRYGYTPHIIKPNVANNENPGNYHAFKAASVASALTAGGFGYSVLRGDKSKLRKASIVIGGLLLGGIAHNWGYKAVAFGSPFTYTKEATKCSIIYYTWDSGGIQDGYIDLKGNAGRIYDGISIISGLWLVTR